MLATLKPAPAVPKPVFQPGEVVCFLNWIDRPGCQKVWRVTGVLRCAVEQGELRIPGTSVSMQGSKADPACMVQELEKAEGDSPDGWVEQECWYLTRMSALKSRESVETPNDPS